MTHPVAKRAFDVTFSMLGLAALSPLFALIAVAIRFSSGAPVLYFQRRIGRHGIPFSIAKFRSMVPGDGRSGFTITRAGDPRITPVGRWLRVTKLDELPQLWNVLKGEMSFVGPRPEVPEYVERYSAEQRLILQLQPGITDLATLHFRNEETLLSQVEDVEKYYVEVCIPKKIELNLRYASDATFWKDIGIILKTILGGS